MFVSLRPYSVGEREHGSKGLCQERAYVSGIEVRRRCRLTVFVCSVPECVAVSGRRWRLIVFVYSVPECVGVLGRRWRLTHIRFDNFRVF